MIEEGVHWDNLVELCMGLLKSSIGKYTKSSDCPMHLWYYCLETCARISNMDSRNDFKIQGSRTRASVTGEQGHMSDSFQFDRCEWAHFRSNKSQFPRNKERLGKVLGNSKGFGNEMCQWTLEESGQVAPCSAVLSLATT